MKRMSWVPVVAVMMTLAAMGTAQENKDAAPKMEAPKGPPVPLDVHFLVTRYQGEKKIASKPYSLRLHAEEKDVSRLFVGTEVPYRTEWQGNPTIAFKMIGAAAKCTARDAGNGRFRLDLEFDEAVGFRPSPQTIAAEDMVDGPMAHSMTALSTLFLRDGETAQLATVGDPITGETAKVEVTLKRAAEASPKAARAAGAPAKIQVVITRRQGEKALSTHPSSISLDDEKGSVYAGVEVPYRVGSPNGATMLFKKTGTSATFNARALEDGRYRLAVEITHSSVFNLPGGLGVPRSAPQDRVDGPLLRTFTTKSILYVRDGETVPLSSAVDPITGEVAKVDITLNLTR